MRHIEVKCVPFGPMTRPVATEYRCNCGEILSAVPQGSHDWRYVDAAGRTEVHNVPAGLAENPTQWWANLAAKDINTYSNLKASLALGNTPPWIHVHCLDVKLTPDSKRYEIPFCCGEPMHAVPIGWRCRVFKTTTVPYADGER